MKSLGKDSTISVSACSSGVQDWFARKEISTIAATNTGESMVTVSARGSASATVTVSLTHPKDSPIARANRTLRGESLKSVISTE